MFQKEMKRELHKGEIKFLIGKLCEYHCVDVMVRGKIKSFIFSNNANLLLDKEF